MPDVARDGAGSSSAQARRTRRHRRLVTGTLLVGILVLGWYVRFENYRQWHKAPQTFFVGGEPVLTNPDGYYYLRLARDLIRGAYAPIDEKRTVPDSPRRPMPPPLLSWATAKVHAATGWSPARIAVFAPTVLGPLVAVPVWLLARALGGGLLMSLGAALLAVLGFQLVDRTRVGFFDTDALNVAFTLASAYLALGFATARGRRRTMFFGAALLNYALFVAWWDQVTEFVAVVCLAPLLFAVVQRHRRERGRLLQPIVLAAILVAAMLLGVRDLAGLPRKAGLLLGMLGGRQSGDFPVVEVAELQRATLGSMPGLTTGHWSTLLAGAAGLLLLAYRKRRQAVYLVIPAGMALLPFFSGERFAIFTVPLVALGFAYAVEVLASRAIAASPPRFHAFFAAAALVLPLLAAVPSYRNATGVLRAPVTRRATQAIEAAGADTEEDAVIWTAWTTGYPLTDRTGRATIVDGQSIQGELHYYAYLPLAQESQRFAANFMQFYVARGKAGMQRLRDAFGGRTDRTMAFLERVLSQAPQPEAAALLEPLVPAAFATTSDARAFLFPPPGRPIYLLLHREFLDFPEWFYYGSWDPARRDGTHIVSHGYYGVRQREGKIHLDASSSIDRQMGGSCVIGSKFIPEHRAKLEHLFEHDGIETHVVPYDPQGTIAFEWIRPMGFGVLMSKEMCASVFNQLFVRHAPDPQHFQKVKLATPDFQLWKVAGDGR